MHALLAVLVGWLYASALYLILRRSIVQLLIGLAILAHAAHLLIFVAAGLTPGRAPLVPEGADAPPGAYADPLPQAMILTSIVISFGILAFTVALVQRTIAITGTDDTAEMGRDGS